MDTEPKWLPNAGTIRIVIDQLQSEKRLYFCSVINDKDNKKVKSKKEIFHSEKLP